MDKEDVENNTQSDNAYDALVKLIDQYRKPTEDMTKPTHCFFGGPLLGKIFLPDDEMGKFLSLYTAVINSGIVLNVVEQHRDIGPILIDIDFKQSKENGERMYTPVTIKNVTRIFNSIIRNYLDVKDDDLKAYIMEKEKPNLCNGVNKDGFHVVYPFICTKPEIQFIMREKLIEKIKEKNIFSKVAHTNNIEDVVDEAVIKRNGWFMYGSAKQFRDPYKITHIYEIKDGEFVDTFKFENQNIRKGYIKILSIRRFINDSEVTNFKDGLDSTELDDILMSYKNKQKEKTKTPDEEVVLEKFTKRTTPEILNDVKTLVRMFSARRSDNYHTWFEVGSCLKNIDDRLYSTWLSFSRLSTKFDEDKCEKYWTRNFKPNRFTIASLHFWAKEDSPDDYNAYRDAIVAEKMDEMDDYQCEHRNIAELLMEKYKYRFKCADVTKQKWYEFKENRWVEIQGGFTLRNMISDLVPQYHQKLSDVHCEIAKELKSGKAGASNPRKNKKTENIFKIISKLNNTSFRDGVMKECSFIAYDPEFVKKLDETPNLICFNNGVYDLEASVNVNGQTGFFRQGYPDDYISMSVGYDYIPYDENDQNAIEINAFLDKIFPEKVMRDYVLSLFASCLSGSVFDESFYIFIGAGANGKSKIMELLKNTLGDYCKPLVTSIVTQKKAASNAATPELADKKGVRCCQMDEPEHDDTIHVGFMKNVTGGDLIMARALFSNPIYYKPQFKPFMLCNNLPTIRATDEGTWRRIKVVKFIARFVKPEFVHKFTVDGKLKLPENHHLADTNLSNSLVEWKQMFMGLLLEHYKILYKKGIYHPPQVTRATDEYQRKSDIYYDFLNENYKKVDDHTLFTMDVKPEVSLIDMRALFNIWHRRNFGGAKVPDRKEMIEYLEKNHEDRLGSDEVYGFILKEPEEKKTPGAKTLQSALDKFSSEMIMKGRN